VTVGKLKEKNMKKNFFASLKSMKKVVGSGVGPDPLVRGSDPEIRIRTNMSRILNTGKKSDSLLACL
jgi:hypothetical protein